MDSKSLTKTSFCGKEIDNVTNNELKKHILDDMCQKLILHIKLNMLESLINNI
jgi:hypothetical protein